MKYTPVGLGNIDAKLVFYIKNRPPLTTYESLNCVKAIVPSEIAHICQETGNHWRKIFNVYAKLLFELSSKQFSSWQHLRDDFILQAHSDNCLLFSTPYFLATSHCETSFLAKNSIESALPEPNAPDSKTLSSTTPKPVKKLHIILGKGYAEQLGLCNDCTWLSHDFAINNGLGIIICPYFDYRQLSNIKIVQLAALIRQLTAPEA
jgi:hypothetical protein